MMNRRTFSATLAAGVAAGIVASSDKTRAQAASKARNVVLVHGAYADGSCWSEVVGICSSRLQGNRRPAPADHAGGGRRGDAPSDRAPGWTDGFLSDTPLPA